MTPTYEWWNGRAVAKSQPKPNFMAWAAVAFIVLVAVARAMT